MAVNHRKDSIQLIRDTEGINNKDRVRILSPGSSPPKETTEVTEHALYMELENTPGDGEPYEYEFACCTGRRFIPQRAGDANKLEGKTSAEVKAMFADGRAIFAGSGTSVTLDAEGERVHSITVNGFTKQSGSGDPSPTNVRALTNGGLKLVKLVLNGTEGWILNSHSGTAASGSRRFQLGMSVTSSNTSAYAVAVAYCSHFDGTTPANTYGSNYDNMFSVQNADLQLRVAGISTVDDLKQFLAACYDAGDPVIVWYAPADESDATGLYAPIILTSGECRATCLSLTAPLCEGDSVASWAKSGCDVEITFDGSENWTLVLSGNGWLRAYTPAAECVPGTAVGDWLRKGTVDEWNTNSGIGYVVTLQSGNIGVCVPTDKTTIQDFKAILAAHPLTVWYRSTNYTEAADIPVSLETHVRWANQLDGTEAWELRTDFLPNLFIAPAVPGIASNNGLSFCDMYKIVVTQWDKVGLNQVMVIKTGNYIGFRDERYSTADAAKRGLAESPVTIVYELATPLVYAHEPVEFEFVKGEDGVFTITGEADGTLDVYYKALQDGGDADKLGGKLPEYYAAAANALGQYTHTKSGTVHELTGTGDNIRFVATADFAAGDTVKVNGTTCTASTMSGDALWAGFFKSGAVVVCYRTGNALNFSGGGLAAAEADKITPENLKTGVSVTVNGKTVAGTFTADGTAAAGDMLLGKTGYVKGQKVTGTIPSKAAASYKPGTSAQTIKAVQYLSGDQTIEGDAALIAANIKYGASIFDVDGSFTGDGNAAAAEILAGKIGYVKGQKVTGSMPNRGAVSQSLAINGTYTIPAGYHNGSGKVTQSIPTKGAASYRPGTSAQTIAAGQYLSGAQTIQGDGNLVAGNIRKGVSIFGVAGTYDPAPSGTLVWCGYGETRNEANEDVAINGAILQGSPYFRVDNSNKVTCIKACTIRIAFNYWRYTEAGLTATLSIRKNGSQIASVYADNNQNATKRYTSGNISVNVGDYFTFRTTGQNASFRKDGCFAYIP